MGFQERMSDLRPTQVSGLPVGCYLNCVLPLFCLLSSDQNRTRKRETFYKQNATLPQKTWGFLLRQAPRNPCMMDLLVFPVPQPLTTGPRGLLSGPPAHPFHLAPKPPHAAPLRKGSCAPSSKLVPSSTSFPWSLYPTHPTHTQTPVLLSVSSSLLGTYHICHDPVSLPIDLFALLLSKLHGTGLYLSYSLLCYSP